MYSPLLAYLLWFFGGCGVLGLHRHYLGKHPTGFLWMFTGGMGFLGSLYDLVTLNQQVNDANIKLSIYNAGLNSMGLPHHQVVPAGSLQTKKPTLEQTILQAAAKNRGLVSPAQVAVLGHYDLDACRQGLEKMASKGHCEMKVSQDGAIFFRFPGLESPDAGNFAL